MAKGDKSRYSDKQKRQAEHIEEGYEKRGTSEDEAERIAWATVNKQDGGGKKSGSGRKSSANKSSSSKSSSNKLSSNKASKSKSSSKTGKSSTRRSTKVSGKKTSK